MSTRDHVLAALRDAGAVGVSGEALAAVLGVSRVAIAKQVSALRALGYRIDAVPGTGYRLVSAPDLALPSEVAPLVKHPFWHRIEGSVQTESTNDDARVLARAGAEEGAVVVAATQRSGRGRLGRTWESPAGGAYFSAILRPPVAPSQAGSLALVVALGVARGLETLGVHTGLKWPNDLHFKGGKLAGVLLEMSAEGDRVEWVVAGVGLNVRRSEPAFSAASYLSDGVPGVRSPHAAAAALDGLASAYVAWLDGGFASLRSEYEKRAVLTGREVFVSDLMGEVRAHGTVLGVDDDGRLLVGGMAGVEAVAAGEVTLR